MKDNVLIPKEDKLKAEVEQYRMLEGIWGTPPFTKYGMFSIPSPVDKKRVLKVLCADMDSSEWQHVSVSLTNRCPNWAEMSYVKDLFWGEDQTVLQFHPKKSEYSNNHPYVLHLWKKAGEEHALPPTILTGVKGLPKDVADNLRKRAGIKEGV